MKIGENGNLQAFRQSSGLRLSRVPTPEAMEEALIEMRELEWREPGGGRSPFAKDGPWDLMQREFLDIAGVYSETLMTDQQGRPVRAWKLESPRPRVPLRVADVDRLAQLRGWLLLLPEAVDRRIIWAASFHLWRGEPMDWAGMKRALAYPHSAQRLARRYREAVCKLVCLVNGVPIRHHRALLVRSGGAFADGVHP